MGKPLITPEGNSLIIEMIEQSITSQLGYYIDPQGNKIYY